MDSTLLSAVSFGAVPLAFLFVTADLALPGAFFFAAVAAGGVWTGLLRLPGGALSADAGLTRLFVLGLPVGLFVTGFGC